MQTLEMLRQIGKFLSHESIATNFENTKKVLDNIKLELPEIPNINDIKLIKFNREKVENEIIKPKDDKITELYQENLKLHNELSKQVKLVNTAEKYQKERDSILALSMFSSGATILLIGAMFLQVMNSLVFFLKILYIIYY